MNELFSPTALASQVLSESCVFSIQCYTGSKLCVINTIDSLKGEIVIAWMMQLVRKHAFVQEVRFEYSFV